MPWRPSHPGERPTLGYYAINWIEENLGRPDTTEYEPLILTREQAEFLLRFYEIDPYSGRRLIRRAVLSRPRGWGKSPFVSALCLLEGLGDVVFDGWDSDGQPVGKPWSRVRRPLVQLAAVSDQQVMTNAWPPLLEMLNIDAPVFDNYHGLESFGSYVNLPWGRIEPITASGNTAKGAPAVFMCWDQTEEWTPGNGGISLSKKLADNVAKTRGTYIETPNAYAPTGEEAASVAQRSAEAWAAMQEGRARLDKGLLYDHREAPGDTDLADRDSLLLGLRLAYGDSSGHPDGCMIHEPPCEPGWADHDSHIARIWDPDNDEQNARANFLGQITGTSDAFMDRPTWEATENEDSVLFERDLITLGFDGSRGRAKGKPDATALIACRISDGHLFELLVLEAPDDRSTWQTWSPDIPRLEREIEQAFEKFDVAAFYADPGSDWRSHVNAWEAKYGSKAKHKMSTKHPFEWWMTGGRSSAVEQSIEQFESAVIHRELSHSPKDRRLTAHMLQARRRRSHGKLALGKESAASSYKIDAAVAAILAWTARLDAIASGVGATREKRVYRAGRLRSGTERGSNRGRLVS